MNIAQNIDTGGISSTKTPMLKLRKNELLLPSDARHMTHCAKVVIAPQCNMSANATLTSTSKNK